MTDSPVAVVTGGAQRIGASICKTLHQRGFNVVIHFNHSQQPAEQLTAGLNQQRANSAICLQASLNNNQSLKRLIEQAEQHWGRLDALINNASGFYPTEISEATEQDWDTLINSNVKGAYFLCQAASPYLAKQRGCIVNIVDIHGARPLGGYSIYSIAKAGLQMLTQSLAKELPPVRVNGVSPGAILWPDESHQDTALNTEQKQHILDKIPLGNLGRPEDIAETVAFLACSAPYITGQIIAVDGGRSLSM